MPQLAAFYFTRTNGKVPGEPLQPANNIPMAIIGLGYFFIGFPRFRLERFDAENFLRHAGEFVKRIGDAGATHFGRFVALVGVLPCPGMRHLPACRQEGLSAARAVR